MVATLANLFSSQYKVVVITNEVHEDDYFTLPEVTRYQLPSFEKIPMEDYQVRARAWSQCIEQYQLDLIINSDWVSPFTFWDMMVIKSHATHPAYALHCHSVFALPFRFQGDKVNELASCGALADGIITLSEMDNQYWRSVNANSHYIPNPYPALSGNPCTFSADQQEILWVGRIAPEKNPFDLIPIMKEVLAQKPNALCRMIGDGDEELVTALKEQIRQNHLEDHLILEPFQTDINAYYQRGSALLLTSSFEGHGLVLYEAAAHGLPIVMYHLPNLECNRLLTGLYQVPQGDTKEAAAKLVTLLSDQGDWEQRSSSLRSCSEELEKVDPMENWKPFFDSIEQGSSSVSPETDKNFSIMMDFIRQFHGESIAMAQSRYQALNDRLQQTYREKSELNAKLQQTYREKSELNAKLQQTYKEKAERGIRIKELEEQLNAKPSVSHEIRSVWAKGTKAIKNLLKKDVP